MIEIEDGDHKNLFTRTIVTKVVLQIKAKALSGHFVTTDPVQSSFNLYQTISIKLVPNICIDTKALLSSVHFYNLLLHFKHIKGK